MEKKNLYMDVQDTLKDELKIVRQKYDEINVSSIDTRFNSASSHEVRNIALRLQKELQGNETHKQLQALERKLAQIEQDNFALREFIADKKCEMNYELSKKQAIELVRAYNDDLKEKYKAGM